MTPSNTDIRKPCRICGQPIPAGRRSYCSADCARIAERERERQRSTPLPQTTPKAYRYLTCPGCGAYVLRHVASTLCAACQEDAKRASVRAYRQRQAAGKSRHIGESYPCEACAKPYILTGGRQRYCPDCGPEQRRKNDNAASRAWNRREYATPEGQAKKVASRQGEHIPFAKTCDVCGKAFCGLRADARFCSPDCRKVHKREYAKAYHADNAEMIRAKNRAKWAGVTPEQREKINATARENYHKRKAQEENKNDR